MSCVSADTARDLVLGRLPAELAETVEEHADTCAACRDLVFAATVAETAGSAGAAPPLKRGGAVGRYLILERLGAGAMGVVYAAYDPELDRKVALKLIRPEIAGSDATARLLREGRAIARLAHPNVVSVFDLGRHAEGAFVAMELVTGASLAAWLQERSRPWPEVLDAFRQAGAGLAAAHAVGLVHRDFKPANVLVGGDGRVRVGDFGLARLDGDHQADPEVPSSDVQLTHSGSFAGTPAYMAPEQFDGKIDAKSDQFSFAVALWEALYGERPFRGAAVPELIADIQTRQPTVPPGHPVPRRIGDALLRALRPDPAARFATLSELLAALSPRKRVSWRWLAAGCIALVVVAVAAGIGFQRASNVCEGADGDVVEVWGSEQRLALVRAFGATGKPYATTAFADVARSLDDYTQRWGAMKTESCKATAVRHVQTEEHQGLRDVCLAERLADVKARVDLLAHADATVVARSQKLMGGLPDLSECADVRALAEGAPVPTDPASRMKWLSLTSTLAAADAMGDAGQYDRALALARAVADQSQAVAAHRVTARALYLAGWLAQRRGDFGAALSLLHTAIDEAEIAHDDMIAARAWITLVNLAGEPGHTEEALWISGHASAALSRAGDPPVERALLEASRGQMFARMRRYKEAIRAYETARAIQERVLEPNDLALARTLDGLGVVYDLVDRYDDAAVVYRRAIAILEARLGPHHPDLALAYEDIGDLDRRHTDYVAAATAYRRACEVTAASVGDTTRLATELIKLAMVLPEEDAKQERALLRAIAILRDGSDRGALTAARVQLAFHYVRGGQVDAAARQLDLEAAEHRDTPMPLNGSYWRARTEIHQARREWALAEQAIHEAIASDVQEFGSEHSTAAINHGYLGRLYDDQGKYEQALAEHRIELAAEEKTFGKDDGGLSVPLTNIGLALVALHRDAESLPYFERALALDEKTFGKTAVGLGMELWGLGEALEHLGRYDDAIARLERSLALDHAASSEELYAHEQLSLAISLSSAGRDRVRALQLATSARDGFAKLGLAKERTQAERWLAAHR